MTHPMNQTKPRDADVIDLAGRVIARCPFKDA